MGDDEGEVFGDEEEGEHDGYEEEGADGEEGEEGDVLSDQLVSYVHFEKIKLTWANLERDIGSTGI